MRKALIAAVVAAALFAVGAFAASFTVQSEDIASGTNPVDSCASSATVDFTEVWVPANNNWEITHAVVTLVGGGVLCIGADVELMLQDDDNTLSNGFASMTKANIQDTVNGVQITGGDAVLTYTLDPDLPVAEVDSASILVDNRQIDTT